jgi:hypothetical protein
MYERAFSLNESDGRNEKYTLCQWICNFTVYCDVFEQFDVKFAQYIFLYVQNIGVRWDLLIDSEMKLPLR